MRDVSDSDVVDMIEEITSQVLKSKKLEKSLSGDNSDDGDEDFDFGDSDEEFDGDEGKEGELVDFGGEKFYAVNDSTLEKSLSGIHSTNQALVKSLSALQKANTRQSEVIASQNEKLTKLSRQLRRLQDRYDEEPQHLGRSNSPELQKSMAAQEAAAKDPWLNTPERKAQLFEIAKSGQLQPSQIMQIERSPVIPVWAQGYFGGNA